MVSPSKALDGSLYTSLLSGIAKLMSTANKKYSNILLSVKSDSKLLSDSFLKQAFETQAAFCWEGSLIFSCWRSLWAGDDSVSSAEFYTYRLRGSRSFPWITDKQLNSLLQLVDLADCGVSVRLWIAALCSEHGPNGSIKAKLMIKSPGAHIDHFHPFVFENKILSVCITFVQGNILSGKRRTNH